MDGILLINKPILWTSHDVVGFVRKVTGESRVGHAGTLDPLAIGLLLILVGRFTKESDRLMGHEKEYEGLATLGLRTDSQDLDGRVAGVGDYSSVTRARVENEMNLMRGSQEQTLPVYSAGKQGGKKMYELARAGLAVQSRTKNVEIKEFELLSFHPPDAGFRVTCSKGTYIRTLCDDLGRRLGCGAVLSALVRTRIGSYLLSDALDVREAANRGAAWMESRLITGKLA